MDRLVAVNFMRSPERVNLGLLNEVKFKIEYCAGILDKLEKNQPIPGKHEDLVINLQVWLMEGEVTTIMVILQLVVELSLKDNLYAKLFIKHDFFSLIYGSMHATCAKDEELIILCCLTLHNLMARERPSTSVAKKLQSLLVELYTAPFSSPLLKVLAIQALGMVNTYYPINEGKALISDFLDSFNYCLELEISFTLSPTDIIILLDSTIKESNNLGLWLLAHGEASEFFDWNFVSLQLRSMMFVEWSTIPEKYYHYFHLAVSNVNNVVPGLWNDLFNPKSNEQLNLPRCGCGKMVARGFADQFSSIRKSTLDHSSPIEDILFPDNNCCEEHSNSDTAVASFEER